MSTVAVAISPRGVDLALRLKKDIGCVVYAFDKYGKEGCESFNCSIKELTSNLFTNYRNIIMVMSCGVAVRTIAPYIDDKTHDPAVVVLDDSGKYSISLLSGHIGGANKLAIDVARAIGAEPIVTTSSDNHGIEAVDMLAKRLGLCISSMEDAKILTAIMLNGGRVAVICDCDELKESIKDYKLTSWGEFENEDLDGIIYIGNMFRLPKKLNMPFVKLIMKNIVIGAGCKRGISAEVLESAVDDILDKNNIDKLSVRSIATVEIKGDEEALCSLAEKRGWKLDLISLKEIKKVQHLFPKSEFVEKTLGVGAVCEPSAYIASNMGRCISHKIIASGSTLCIYELMY